MQERSERTGMIAATTENFMFESVERRGFGDLDDCCVALAGWWGDGESTLDL